jgi:hypothetical protein
MLISKILPKQSDKISPKNILNLAKFGIIQRKLWLDKTSTSRWVLA